MSLQDVTYLGLCRSAGMRSHGHHLVSDVAHFGQGACGLRGKFPCRRIVWVVESCVTEYAHDNSRSSAEGALRLLRVPVALLCHVGRDKVTHAVLVELVSALQPSNLLSALQASEADAARGLVDVQAHLSGVSGSDSFLALEYGLVRPERFWWR